MLVASVHQGYFLTVSQLPLPWVMALCDSLSDSDEVMSEPRTKLSLLCPTETLSLLAFYTIDLFFLSSPHFHFIHYMRWLAEYIMLLWGMKKNVKRKNPLHHCPKSCSLYSVIHPHACSTQNGLIYWIPLQQWEREREGFPMCNLGEPCLGHVIEWLELWSFIFPTEPEAKNPTWEPKGIDEKE